MGEPWDGCSRAIRDRLRGEENQRQRWGRRGRRERRGKGEEEKRDKEKLKMAKRGSLRETGRERERESPISPGQGRRHQGGHSGHS